MKTAVEIYKLLPKTNCGKCGTGTCFGFAAKLATHQGLADDCPEITEEARAALREAAREQAEDAVYEIRFFPHYPVLLQFYDAVPAEDFPAQCKLLLEKTAPKYLDLESMVVLGEEFSARLTA